MGILVSLIISLVIFTFGRRVNVHQQLVLGDFELMELVLVSLLRCIQIGMECRTCTIDFSYVSGKINSSCVLYCSAMFQEGIIIYLEILHPYSLCFSLRK